MTRPWSRLGAAAACVSLVSCSGTPAPESAKTVPPPMAVRVTEVARLSQPIALATRAGDAAIYIAERTGAVRRLRDGVVDPTPVLDLSAATRAQGERGLLGIVFSTDGRWLYTSYTDLAGDSQLDEYAIDSAGRVDATSRRSVLKQAQPYANHNGGNIVIGPDGYLYYGLGDGGAVGDPENRAQDRSTILGKLIRIDPRGRDAGGYSIPADNPFVGEAGARAEIWSFGLRNPWRFAFDSDNGDLWIADVGQLEVEEIDVARAAAGRGKGVNYGWNAYEGRRRYNRAIDIDGTQAPVFTYEHDATPGGCAITGGYVYRGSALPALRGWYLFADYCRSGVRALSNDASEVTTLSDAPGSIISFGQDARGELYVLTLDGLVARLDPA